MKNFIHLAVFTLILIVGSCASDNLPLLTTIPNGDFENWDKRPSLQNWKTNSCPECLPPFNTYIVQKDSSFVYHGLYSALFVFNNVYPSWAENKFPVKTHPSSLNGFVRGSILGTDSVYIKIRLFNKGVVIDSGRWFGTSLTSNYERVMIPITQSSPNADTVIIRIQGGHRHTFENPTALWVDYFTLQ
jgi:hypothetical protein